MSKLVSLSDETYAELKKLKDGDKSFSQVILLLLGEKKNREKRRAELDQLFGILGHDKKRAKKWKEQIRYQREHNWDHK